MHIGQGGHHLIHKGRSEIEFVCHQYIEVAHNTDNQNMFHSHKAWQSSIRHSRFFLNKAGQNQIRHSLLTDMLQIHSKNYLWLKDRCPFLSPSEDNAMYGTIRDGKACQIFRQVKNNQNSLQFFSPLFHSCFPFHLLNRTTIRSK